MTTEQLHGRYVSEARFAEVLAAIGEHRRDAVAAARFMCLAVDFESPKSISRVACDFLRLIADYGRNGVPDDLRPFYAAVIGSCRENESKHRFQIIDWVYRDAALIWCFEAGCDEAVARIKKIKPITDIQASDGASPTMDSISARYVERRLRDLRRSGQTTENDEREADPALHDGWLVRCGVQAAEWAADSAPVLGVLCCRHAAELVLLTRGPAAFDAAMKACERSTLKLLKRMFDV